MPHYFADLGELEVGDRHVLVRLDDSEEFVEVRAVLLEGISWVVTESRNWREWREEENKKLSGYARTRLDEHWESERSKVSEN